MISLLGLDILNTPWALALIVIGVVLIIAIIVYFTLIGPKIAKKIEQKKLLNDSLKQKQQAEINKDISHDANIFAHKNDKVASKSAQEKKENVSSVIDTMNHVQKDFVVENKKKEEIKQNKAEVDDVVNILQGKAASANAYKKVDAFKEKVATDKKNKDKEINDKANKEKAGDVVHILQGKAASDKVVVEAKTKDSKEKTTDDKSVSDVLNILGKRGK